MAQLNQPLGAQQIHGDRKFKRFVEFDSGCRMEHDRYVVDQSLLIQRIDAQFAFSDIAVDRY